MSQFYNPLPFAATGDRQPIPLDAQPDGALSIQSGYTDFYSRNPTPDPETGAPADLTARRIERLGMNELFYMITAGLKELQEFGCAPYIEPSRNNGVPFPYSRGAVVMYDRGDGMAMYQSQLNSNTTAPSNTTNWKALKAVQDIDLSGYAKLAGNNTFTGENSFMDKLISEKGLTIPTRNTERTTFAANTEYVENRVDVLNKSIASAIDVANKALTRTNTIANGVINNLGSSGCAIFPMPGGVSFILNWGFINSGGPFYVNFPVRFPNTHQGVVATNAGGEGTARVSGVSQGGFTWSPAHYSGTKAYYLAWGY